MPKQVINVGIHVSEGICSTDLVHAVTKHLSDIHTLHAHCVFMLIIDYGCGNNLCA